MLVPRIEIVELLAYAGFQAVIFDFEHGGLDFDHLPVLAAVANRVGMHAIARVQGNEPSLIGRALDAGVDGILVPHVRNEDDAQRLVAAGRFPPEGSRGANPYVRAARYSADQAYFDHANDRVALLGMIEGVEGLDSLDRILATRGLDGIFVGPVDLSASLGVTGNTESEEVRRAVEGVLEAANAAERAAGVFAPTPSAAVRWKEGGAQIVALSVDTGMAYQGFLSFVREVSSQVQNASAPVRRTLR
ncbi:MAG: aldolase/citrate lyase family protein [Gaiellaceae bacterium]